MEKKVKRIGKITLDGNKKLNFKKLGSKELKKRRNSAYKKIIE